MNVGLLWHDSSAKKFNRKLAQAAERYQTRFGKKPNVCYVNPATMPEGDLTIEGILIRASSRILRNHFWVGQEQT